MKPFVIAICTFVGVFILYGISYLLNFYSEMWWINPTVTLGILTISASIIGIMYAILEMK